MFLVAQRVVTSYAEGTNAYYHSHGLRSDWETSLPDGIPDRHPGVLQTKHIEAEGLGRIASFLDIAAPDGTPLSDLRWLHAAIVSLGGVGAIFPLVIVSGPFFVRYDLDSDRRDQWRPELDALVDAALPLVPVVAPDDPDEWG